MDRRNALRLVRLPALALAFAALAACSDSQSVTPLGPSVDGPSLDMSCRGYIGSGGRAGSGCEEESTIQTDDCSGYIGSGGCRMLPAGALQAPGRSNAGPQR